MSAPYVELKKPLSEYALLCRGCLAESGEMKNMQEWGLADDFYLIAEVPKRDDVTELLCTACEESLAQCRGFRRRCQEADAFLKDTAKKKTTKSLKQETSISCILREDKLILAISANNTDSKILLPCPYATKNQCREKYLKRYLHNHLVKHHGFTEKSTIDCQYYCLYDDCSYNYNSDKSKYFSERKYLNQHYNKVHSTKILCERCNLSLCQREFERHLKTCNVAFLCDVCYIPYKSHERLLVHMMRRHPEMHEQYKKEKKAKKRLAETVTESKKVKVDDKVDYMYDSPKRSLATQTKPEDNIRNDVALPSWKLDNEAKTDEISTQTVFEDLLSLKSQTSEDDIFFSETVSLSDIQTQTFPVEFGLSKSHKETITSETQSPDLSIKETQTCGCLCDTPKLNLKLFDSVSSSPLSISLASAETQTGEFKFDVKSDDLLSFHSTETQTCFDVELSKESL
ncbi:uncharacterized protein [Choristoneura fumiferana]|uniref:uncharacterized protein n=1 Tax=Choristoneura fumiferana TaxID=7141 RepID=UPI003D158B8C